TVHTGGGRAGWQVGSADEARDAQDAGCDVIVAQGIEAGGHVRGTTGLLPLLEEVRAAVDLPLVAAGGIGSGRAMAAALVAGADAVRVGTRFLAATESIAHPIYIDALIRAGADDTVVTTPSARRRRACSRSWPGTSRPVEVTTRHHGYSSPARESSAPTARAAPGRPASVATSPYVTTSPGCNARSTAPTASSKSVTPRRG